MNGCLVVISGPSAVGKTSVATALLREWPELFGRVVTCTTRAPRGGEIHCIDYHFMSEAEFLDKKSKDHFLEDSHVYHNYYGVLRSAIEDVLNLNKNALLVLNWEGYLKIKKKMLQNLVGIFLLPPSMEVLEERIRFRGHDSEEVIQKRLKMNEEDLKHADEFDYQLVNHKIDETAYQIKQLIENITK